MPIPVEHTVAYIYPAGPVLGLDGKNAGRSDNNVIDISPPDVHMVDRPVTERFQVMQGPTDLALAVGSFDPGERVESTPALTETIYQDDECEAKEGAPPPTEPKDQKYCRDAKPSATHEADEQQTTPDVANILGHVLPSATRREWLIPRAFSLQLLESISASSRTTRRRASGYIVRKSMMWVQS